MMTITALFIAALAAGSPQLQIGLDEHVGDQLPLNLPFTTTTGDHVTLAHVFDGKHPVLLVMAYARCEMLCSVVLHGVSDAVNASKLTAGTDYIPVVVSLDPTETPGEAGRRQEKLLADTHHAGDRAAFPYLVGDDAAIHALASALGFRYAWDERTKQYAHPVVIFALTPDGHIAEYLRGVTFPGFDAALTRAAHGQTTDSLANDLISCFHFDPSLHRYGAAIELFWRLGAALVLAMLVGLIALLIRWERRHAR
jgi:protein SCO1